METTLRFLNTTGEEFDTNVRMSMQPIKGTMFVFKHVDCVPEWVSNIGFWQVDEVSLFGIGCHPNDVVVTMVVYLRPYQQKGI